MNFKEFYSDYSEEIISLLSKNRANRVNGAQRFVSFIIEKFDNNELDPEFDDLSKEEIIEIATGEQDQLILWVKENKPELSISSKHSWKLTSDDKNAKENIVSEVVSGITENELNLLNIEPSSIDESNSEKLKQILNKLESLEHREKTLEAKCALLIAEAGYKQKDDQVNAKDWEVAGDKCLETQENKKAKRYFSIAARLFSQSYMYKESARTFKKAIDAVDYYAFDKIYGEDSSKVEKENFKKLLVDCRLQYEHAGQNQEAAEIFIKENDILTNESTWYKKPLLKLFKYTALYGESPWRVFITSLIVMCISVIIYYIFGVHDGETTVKGEFGTSVYFALVTFTTLGYGDYSPIGAVRFVATAQALLGLLLTSLFMVTLVRKFSR